MHPIDAKRNAEESQTAAFLLLLGGNPTNERISRSLSALAIPGFTILPSFGGWRPTPGAKMETEPGATVLLSGIHSGLASQAAERLRATFGQSSVMVLPLAMASQPWSVGPPAPSLEIPADWADIVPKESEGRG